MRFKLNVFAIQRKKKQLIQEKKERANKLNVI